MTTVSGLCTVGELVEKRSAVNNGDVVVVMTP